MSLKLLLPLLRHQENTSGIKFGNNEEVIAEAAVTGSGPVDNKTCNPPQVRIN